MEFINDFEKNNNNFASKIKDSKYLEKSKRENVSENKGCKDICEIIIGENEIEYSSLNESEKVNFIRNKKLDIASNINLLNKDGKNPYIKKWNTKLIQNGLQNPNNLSSILYLNELYKVKTVIYNVETNKYYSTTLKNYEPLYFKYQNNSWQLIKNENVLNEKTFIKEMNDLSDIINIDIDSIYIYAAFLGSLSKYKMSDLEIIAKQENIIMNHTNGKKKLKKDIYDEINLKHYIQDI
tara:strand:- start:1493 stop:2206 length:714 start_codon:yes stop_codon:yes gene_type:complete